MQLWYVLIWIKNRTLLVRINNRTFLVHIMHTENLNVNYITQARFTQLIKFIITYYNWVLLFY